MKGIVIPNEIISATIINSKQRQPDIMCLLMEIQHHLWNTVAKNEMLAEVPRCNSQCKGNTREHRDLFCDGKMRTVTNYRTDNWSLQKKKKITFDKSEIKGKGVSRLRDLRHINQSQWMGLVWILQALKNIWGKQGNWNTDYIVLSIHFLRYGNGNMFYKSPYL